MTLTSGSIKKLLVLFSIPIFLGILLQQLYNVIHVVVAGRLMNEDTLSAIGVSVPIYLLIHSLASILVKLFIIVLLIEKSGLLSIAIASCLGWCGKCYCCYEV